MARSTQVLKTGLQILAGTDVPIYTLEYLDSTKLHKAGDFEKVVVPFIEMGRDNNCVIRFEDDSPLVSRKHAAIAREKGDYILKHLSKTNSTYLNGNSISQDVTLKNGDEIRLSAQGPRLRFNTTATGTAKLGFTNRMNLVVQQAVRPYKRTLVSFSIVFLVAIAGLSYALIDTNDKLQEQIALTESSLNEIKKINSEKTEFVSTFQANEKKFKSELANLRSKLAEKEKAERDSNPIEKDDAKNENQSNLEKLPTSQSAVFADYVPRIEPYVMALFVNSYQIEFNGELIEKEVFEEPICMCSGFLLSTGQFVTARHCVDLLMDDGSGVNNFWINSGGTIRINFSAKSIDSRLNFDFVNTNLTYDQSKDLNFRTENEGLIGVYREQKFFNGSDWAVVQTQFKEGLDFDKTGSSKLATSTELFIMGFPDGMEYRQDKSLHPDFSKGSVRRGGLINGVIHGVQGAERGGNSGGPVFTFIDGELKVVGIVTGATMDEAGDPVYQVYTPMNNITSIQ